MFADLKEVIYSPLSQTQSYKAALNGDTVVITSSEDKRSEFKFETSGETLKVFNNKEAIEVLIALEYLLGHAPKLKKIILSTPVNFLGAEFDRSEFFQLPTLWHYKENYQITPEKWTETDGRAHPIRAPHYQGVFYKRYIPHLGKTITFRLTNIETDLDTFHAWHNSPRVSFFWELNQPKAELKVYMEKGLKNPHQIPMLVEMDGEPLGYYEMYWTSEDRLGPYYDHDAFDRGFHFLIGNKKFLGFSITDSVIKSGLHLLFLDEARTRRIMAEPRHDNQKVLKYAEASIGWKKLKEFDFPHKRAALLENSREVFFGGNAL